VRFSTGKVGLGLSRLINFGVGLILVLCTSNLA
jgi:hypothetical protein